MQNHYWLSFWMMSASLSSCLHIMLSLIKSLQRFLIRDNPSDISWSKSNIKSYFKSLSIQIDRDGFKLLTGLFFFHNLIFQHFFFFYWISMYLFFKHLKDLHLWKFCWHAKSAPPPPVSWFTWNSKKEKKKKIQRHSQRVEIQ